MLSAQCKEACSGGGRAGVTLGVYRQWRLGFCSSNSHTFSESGPISDHYSTPSGTISHKTDFKLTEKLKEATYEERHGYMKAEHSKQLDNLKKRGRSGSSKKVTYKPAVEAHVC